MAFSFLKKANVTQPGTLIKAAAGKYKAIVDADPGDVNETQEKKKSNFSWLKTGKAALSALATEEARAAAAKAEADKMWRFMLQPDESAKITFLDGELNEDGALKFNAFYEHTIKLNGRWRNFICVAEIEEPEDCPLCARSDSPKTYVGALTIIDHRKHKIQNGPNAGKFIVNDRKLFVAKRGTLKLLTKIAIKHDGLAGCMFEDSRGNDKSPNVGVVFDFIKKYDSYDDIAAEWSLPMESVMPADYGEEITFYSASELIALGVAKAITGPGYSGNSSGKTFGSGKKVSGAGMADKL